MKLPNKLIRLESAQTAEPTMAFGNVHIKILPCRYDE